MSSSPIIVTRLALALNAGGAHAAGAYVAASGSTLLPGFSKPGAGCLTSATRGGTRKPAGGSGGAARVVCAADATLQDLGGATSGATGGEAARGIGAGGSADGVGGASDAIGTQAPNTGEGDGAGSARGRMCTGAAGESVGDGATAVGSAAADGCVDVVQGAPRAATFRWAAFSRRLFTTLLRLIRS
jgi:hypothetical protein